MASPPASVELRALERRDAQALRTIRQQPAVLAWWGPLEPGFPFETDEEERLTILADGRVAGMIQFGEEPDPDYRYATIDLFVDTELHGRGIGSAAITAVLRELHEVRGHHRVTIDPAAGNARAIQLYERLGFRPVGVLHRSERDRVTGEWRDQLLMEWLADPPG